MTEPVVTSVSVPAPDAVRYVVEALTVTVNVAPLASEIVIESAAVPVTVPLTLAGCTATDVAVNDPSVPMVPWTRTSEPTLIADCTAAAPLTVYVVDGSSVTVLLVPSASLTVSDVESTAVTMPSTVGATTVIDVTVSEPSKLRDSASATSSPTFRSASVIAVVPFITDAFEASTVSVQPSLDVSVSWFPSIAVMVM